MQSFKFFNFSKPLYRLFSTTEKEKLMYNKLKEALKPTVLEVIDKSGGCGSMYRFKIESPIFAGKTKIQQHQLVNKILADEIKQMHGFTLETSVPKS